MGRTTLITHPVSEQTKRFGSQYNRQVWTFVWGLLDNFAIALIEESPPKVRCADSSAIRMILISAFRVFLTSVKWEIQRRHTPRSVAWFSNRRIFELWLAFVILSMYGPHNKYVMSFGACLTLFCHRTQDSFDLTTRLSHTPSHTLTHRVLQYIFTLDSKLPAATCYYSPEDYYVCQRPAAMRIDTPAFSAFV